MKTMSGIITFSMLLVCVPGLQATQRYVSLTGGNAPPFVNWTDAATNIQAAIDASVAGDEIIVTNGVYATGGRAVYGMITNRVAVDKPIVVRSVNGPQFTAIVGSQVPGTTNGNGAIRCVYLTNGAVLGGFTLTNGATRSTGYYDQEQSGGGVWCASASAVVSNCVLTGNSAFYGGGGAYSGTLKNCALTGNFATFFGGGAYSGTLNNCTLIGNTTSTNGGGGSYCGALNNCIVYFNNAPGGTNANYVCGTFSNCCTTPMPISGANNIVSDPQFASAFHLSASSPCQGAGSAKYASGLDIDGQPWATPPSIGCDEYWSGTITGALSVAIQAAYTNAVAGIPAGFTALINGQASASLWNFGEGWFVLNEPYVTHTWAAAGDYPVELTVFNEDHPNGVVATLTMHVVDKMTYYVSQSSTNPTPPYTSWATAATNIQDAIDAVYTAPRAIVLVNDGVYAFGGRAVYGMMTNRVVVNKPITLLSVNGPNSTVIKGSQVLGTTNGNGAIRCVYLTNGAVLSGFTLANGATRSAGDAFAEQSGGGAWCASTNMVVLSNCVLAANSAYYGGGGTYYGMLNNCRLTGNSAFAGGGAFVSTLINCTLSGNSATSGGGTYAGTLTGSALTGNFAGSGGGGGAYSGILNNCTLTGNSASIGGGAYLGALNNCIVYFNNAPSGSNYSGGTLNYCCTTPLATSGAGNRVSDPQLASAYHISANSPCRRAGSASYASGVDIDGEPWVNPPSIGCDEYQAGSVTGPLNVAIQASLTNVVTGFTVSFSALVSGRLSASVWNFGDGLVVSNCPYASHAWAAPADYPVVLTAYNDDNPGGVSATVTVHVVETMLYYVSQNGTNSVPPYLSWATAATNIQDAIDAVYTAPKAVVLVSNGVYALGGRVVSGAMTNRVLVNKPITLLSVNGPDSTFIKGSQAPGTTNGNGAIRCVYLTNGAVLSGFTLTNGATRGAGGSAPEQSAGGIWCVSANAVVSNCVLVANSANYAGGGTYGGTLVNCTFRGNSANIGGGAYSSMLTNCVLTGNWATNGGGAYAGTLASSTLSGNSAVSGGGAYGATLNRCTLTQNQATYGGGACTGTLSNCLLADNSATEGGGADSAGLNNCTLAGNWADDAGGGANNCTLVSCIAGYNSAWDGGNYFSSTLNYCATTPLPASGLGNIASAPLFVDFPHGNLHLQSNSPCINAGNNAYSSGPADLDGLPRISGGTVDMGAFEFQNPSSVLSYAWARQYGIATDGSADYADPDHDGMNNWQEWRCGTNPTNAASALRMISCIPAGTNAVVTWQSVTGVTYTLEFSTTLATPPQFWPLAANLPGQAGTTTFIHTNTAAARATFYRVRVQ
jgi:hypothetical protein